jgi:hypothetical protein
VHVAVAVGALPVVNFDAQPAITFPFHRKVILAGIVETAVIVVGDL